MNLQNMLNCIQIVLPFIVVMPIVSIPMFFFNFICCSSRKVCVLQEQCRKISHDMVKQHLSQKMYKCSWKIAQYFYSYLRMFDSKTSNFTILVDAVTNKNYYWYQHEKRQQTTFLQQHLTLSLCTVAHRQEAHRVQVMGPSLCGFRSPHHS